MPTLFVGAACPEFQTSFIIRAAMVALDLTNHLTLTLKNTQTKMTKSAQMSLGYKVYAHPSLNRYKMLSRNCGIGMDFNPDRLKRYISLPFHLPVAIFVIVPPATHGRLKKKMHMLKTRPSLLQTKQSTYDRSAVEIRNHLANCNVLYKDK